jgi:hypothetical protein
MRILQFWTWRTELYVTIRGELSSPSHSQTRTDSESTTTTTAAAAAAAAAAQGQGQGQLCQCNIADKAGDWCGSIVLPRFWIAEQQGVPLLFIAVSDVRSFTFEGVSRVKLLYPQKEGRVKVRFVLSSSAGQES